MIFNPIEFEFRDLGKSTHGQTFQNEIVDIRRVDGWVLSRWVRISDEISPNDIWKIKYKNESKYIYVGKIPNKYFALELLTNLESISEDLILKLKRDLSLEDLLK